MFALIRYAGMKADRKRRVRKSKWNTLNERVTFRSSVQVVSEIYYWALASLNPLRLQGQATSEEQRRTHIHF